jgi:hypothetical protein
MALIYCPECKKRVSDTASACPNCGYRLTPEIVAKVKNKSEKTKKIIGVGFILLVFLICLPVFTSKNQTNQSNQVNKDIPSINEVNSMIIRGKTIKIGDTADYVFKILTNADLLSQNVSKDPNNPNSLLAIKNYEADGQKFTIYFSRIQDPGPYKVVKIIKS